MFGQLNLSTVLQQKLPTSCLSPLICPFCLQHGEDPSHLLFLCSYSAKFWEKLFSILTCHGCLIRSVENRLDKYQEGLILIRPSRYYGGMRSKHYWRSYGLKETKGLSKQISLVGWMVLKLVIETLHHGAFYLRSLICTTFMS